MTINLWGTRKAERVLLTKFPLPQVYISRKFVRFLAKTVYPLLVSFLNIDFKIFSSQCITIVRKVSLRKIPFVF